MENIFNPTNNIGKELIWLSSCHSTNDILATMAREGNVLSGCVLVTDTQEKGRGQRGSGWESEINKNLTFSCLLNFDKLPVAQQFYISKVICLAVKETVSKHISYPVEVKWPNDVYVSGRKIAGILIENNVKLGVVESSIAGIGLNINQVKFSCEKAVSLANITGEEIDKRIVLFSFIEIVNEYFSKGIVEINALYLSSLYQHQEWAIYFNVKLNQTFKGKIIGVEPAGYLIIETVEGNQLKFDVKEVTFL